jgi:hypothetical protein
VLALTQGCSSLRSIHIRCCRSVFLLTAEASFHLLGNKITLVLTLVYGPIQFLLKQKITSTVSSSMSAPFVKELENQYPLFCISFKCSEIYGHFPLDLKGDDDLDD